MRNFKKIIAVAITLVMLLSVAAIGVSAETAPTLSLVGDTVTGKTTGTALYELAVVLSDGADVGGIEGVITYDNTKFDYDSVALDAAFVAAGNADEASVLAVDETAGTIKFVGLNAANVTKWFTLKFAATNEGTAEFGLTTKGANAAGSAYVTVTPDAPSVNIVDADAIKIAGAGILLVEKADAQDIRFRAEVDETVFAEKYGDKTVAKIGALMMYTKRLGDRELLVDMEDKTGLVHSFAEYNKAESFNVKLNGMAANQVGIMITARAYVEFADGSRVYTTNYEVAPLNATNGTVSRSVLQVAKLAALDAIANGASAAKGEDENYYKTLAETASIMDTTLREELFAFVVDNEQYLTKDANN